MLHPLPQISVEDAVLALVSETMIPEAFYGSPLFNGLLLVVGFVALLILLVFSH